MNKKNNEYFYTYNLKQAEFFIKNRLVSNKIDNHKGTKKVFFQFMRNEELEKALTLWGKRKR